MISMSYRVVANNVSATRLLILVKVYYICNNNLSRIADFIKHRNDGHDYISDYDSNLHITNETGLFVLIQ